MKSVSRIVVLATSFLAIVAFLFSCAKVPVDNTIYVTGITLNKTSVTIYEGKSVSLTATVSPHDATNQTVLWSTSNANVATVANGVVTAIGLGTATITAKSDDGGKTASCAVTVKAAVVAVTSVSISKTSLSMTEGDSETLTATVYPANATNHSVTWSSNNTAVATVSSAGVVSAKTPGTATITVQTNDGNKTATCKVTVSAKTYSVTGVSLDKSSLTITEGEQATLTATVSPSNASNKAVTWSSNKTSVATVDQTGKITAKSAGTATISVKTADGGHTASCSVTVKAKTINVTGVSLNKPSLSLKVGETSTLTATVAPSNATDKSVTWSSSNTSVASVSSSGVVTAKAVGSATITVKTTDGSKTAICSITVTANTISVTGVTLNINNLSLTVGQSQTLTATISPSNATNKAVIWTSSNSSVASVSSTGLVTAKSAGNAVINVITDDGGKTASCNVTVKAQTVSVTGISLNYSSGWYVWFGETLQLEATVSPENATVKDVTWSSSNPSVVSVSQSGLVTGLAPGEAIITATSVDGGFSATCPILVKVTAVQGIVLSKVPQTMEVGEIYTRTSAFVYPEDAYDRSVRWSSSNTSVITVNEQGHLTAISEGTATVTVTTNDGNYSKSATITVTPAITRYKVILNLPGCTINNYETPIVINNPYSATVSSLSNYTLSSILCTMGGVQQTVDNYSINIQNVTGNVVITATATYNGEVSGTEEIVYMAWCKDGGTIPDIPSDAVRTTTINHALVGTFSLEVPVDGYGFYMWVPKGVTIPSYARAVAIDGTQSPFMDLTDLRKVGSYQDMDVYQGYCHDDVLAKHLYKGTVTYQF